MDGFKERLRNKINTKRNEIMYIDYGITFDGVCDPVATEMIAVVTAMTRFFFFFLSSSQLLLLLLDCVPL